MNTPEELLKPHKRREVLLKEQAQLEKAKQNKESYLTTQNPDNVFEGQGVDLDLMLYTLERRNSRSRKCKEFLLYIPFIILVVIWMFMSTYIHDGFWMNYSLKDFYLDEEFPGVYGKKKCFYNIGNVEEYWQWVEGPLLAGLFVEEGYDEEPLPENEKRYAQSYNKLIGALRLRQQRVRNDSCVTLLHQYGVPKDTLDYDTNCYGGFGGDTFDTKPFGPNGRFVYKTCDEAGGGFRYWGKKTYNGYGCDGYTEIIPFSWTEEQAAEYLAQLKKDHWIDAATRFTIAEYHAYNPNLNYFVGMRAAIEWTPGGGTLPSWEFRIYKLEVLRTPTDYVLFSISLLLIPWVLFYIYQWFKEMYITYISNDGKWWLHLLNVWNALDIVNFGLFITSFILRLIWWVHPDRTKFQITTNTYPRTDEIAFIYSLDQQIMAFNCIVSFFKIFKFFSLHARFNVLSLTIEKALWPLIAVGILLFICVGSFSFVGWLLFGFDMNEFKDWETAASTLLRILTGDSDYEGMRQANRYYTPYYFTAFVIIGLFTIMNMFMAVINDAFGDVNANAQEIDLDLDTVKKIVSDGTKNYYNKGSSALGKISRNIKRTIAREAIGGEKLHAQEAQDVSIDHGDRDIIKLLKKYQEFKEGAPLTIDDLKSALGPRASYALVQRVMSRFDKNRDGTIEVDELAEEQENEPVPQKKPNILDHRSESSLPGTPVSKDSSAPGTPVTKESSSPGTPVAKESTILLKDVVKRMTTEDLQSKIEQLETKLNFIVDLVKQIAKED